MFSYIRGELAEVMEEGIVIETGGVGFFVRVPQTVVSALPPQGRIVKVYTHFRVSEDAMQLYGFLSREDLELFRSVDGHMSGHAEMNHVPGVDMSTGSLGQGISTALGVLSVLTADDVRFAVLSDDSKTIARAPGIGPKTAKKIILELKDRLSLEDAFEHRLSQNRQEDDVLPPAMNPQDEAVQALAALGYSAAESLRAVRSLEDTEGMDTETILKMALKKLSRF